MAERFGSASDTPASTSPVVQAGVVARFGSANDESSDAQTPLEHFGSKMVEGSSLLSMASHPIDTFKSLSGYNEMRKTVDAYEAGDYKAAAANFLNWAFTNPGTKAADSLIATSREQFGKAIDAFKAGDYPLVLSHGGAAILPILKPLAESAELAKKGDLAGAGGLVAGQVFDMAAPAALKEYGPAVVQGTADAASATADNLTRIAAEHPTLAKNLGAGAGGTAGGAVGSVVGLPGPGAIVGGYLGRQAGSALSRAAQAKMPPAFPDTPPELPVEVAPPVAVDPALDAIAQRLGAKDFSSGGKALQEVATQIKQGNDAANAARAAQPAPAAAQGPVTPAPTVAATAPAQPAVTDPAIQLGGGGPLRPPLAPVPRGTGELPVVTPGAPDPPSAWIDQNPSGYGPSRQGLYGNRSEPIDETGAGGVGRGGPHAVYRAAMVDRFVNEMGGTHNLPTTESDWHILADKLGEDHVPSPATRLQIEAKLNQRMVAGTETPGSNKIGPQGAAPSDIPNWVKNAKDPTKALKAAEKLKQAIQ